MDPCRAKFNITAEHPWFGVHVFSMLPPLLPMAHVNKRSMTSSQGIRGYITQVAALEVTYSVEQSPS